MPLEITEKLTLKLKKLCPRSSGGQSGGFLNRRPGVRVTPGAGLHVVIAGKKINFSAFNFIFFFFPCGSACVNDLCF